MNILKLRWYLYGLAFALGIMASALLWQNGYVHYLLALSGDPARQYGYGQWLAEKDLKKEAVMWMSLAADHNEPRAMVWLGLAYQGGGYFAYPNFKRSFHYFKESAERNAPEGMLGYALLFETWKGIRDLSPREADAGAFVWYSRAAEAGLKPAIERMISIYEKGEFGVNTSETDAAYWRLKLK